jgi:hypothetical protein
MIQRCVRIAKNVVPAINAVILRAILPFWQGNFVLKGAKSHCRQRTTDAA